eukprot:211234-Rhodomonas_salina.2
MVEVKQALGLEDQGRYSLYRAWRHLALISPPGRPCSADAAMLLPGRHHPREDPRAPAPDPDPSSGSDPTFLRRR